MILGHESWFTIIMNHLMCKSLFGKQESQESIQECQNQGKILESCWYNIRVTDPSVLYMAGGKADWQADEISFFEILYRLNIWIFTLFCDVIIVLLMHFNQLFWSKAYFKACFEVQNIICHF